MFSSVPYKSIIYESNPVTEFIQALAKGFTPFSNTIHVGHETKVLKVLEDQLFIGLKNGEVVVYDLTVSVILKKFKTNENKLFSMDIDKNNSLILTIGESGQIKYFDYEGKMIKNIQSNHKNTVKNMLIFDGCLYLTDIDGFLSYRKDDKGKIIKGHDNKITCLAKYGKIATGGNDCCIKIWDEDLNLLGEMRSTRFIRKICFLGEKVLVSAGKKSLFCAWDVEKYEILREIQSEENWIRSISASNCSEYIISGTNDACVRYWHFDSKSGEAFESFVAHDGAVTSILANPSGSLIFTASKDRTVKVWQTCREVKVNTKLLGHTDTITCLSLTDDDLFLYSAGADTNIIKWDLKTHSISKTIKGHEQTITGLAQLEEKLISVSEDRNIIIWKNDLLYKKSRLSEYLLSVCISSNYIFAGGRGGSIYIFDKNLQLIKELTGHFNSVSSLVTGCNMLFSASYDRTIKTWNLDSFELAYTIKAHSSAIKKLCFVSQDNKLMSVSCDKTLRVWFEGDPPLEICLKEHDYQINAISLNSNGWYTFTGDSKGIVNIWCNQELVKLGKIDLGEPVHDIVSLKTDPLCLIASGNKIYMISDLFAENQLMTIPNKQSFLYLLYLSSLLKGKSINFKQPFRDYIVVPLRINLLHIMAFANDFQGIREAMKNEVKFFSSSGENPLRIALDQGSFQCVDAILKYIPIYSKKGSPFIFKSIENEFIELFSLNLKNLPTLLNEAFPIVKSKHLPNFGVIKCTTVITSETINIVPDSFGLKEGAKDAIEFHGCVFRLPLNIGSKDCNSLLRHVLKCENPEVFDQILVQKMLEYLMRCAYKYLVLMSILNFCSIVLLFLYFSYFKEYLSFTVFIMVVNGFYFINEVLQMVQSWEYYSADFWNIIDGLRIFCTFYSVCAILSGSSENTITNLTSLTMLFNMIRFISLFRLFEGTRYMIRMIFEVVSDISSFLLVLLMTTLTITISFYFANNQKSDFETIFLQSYLMNFGQIDLTNYQDNIFIKSLFFFALFLNPLVMMNLLIATMGDTFSRIQATLVISNYKEIASLVLEVSSFMLWKRNKNDKVYLQCCTKKEASTFTGSLSMKMKKMKLDVDKLLQISNENSAKLDKIIEFLSK
ncbi:hypothetical protein SteCoe_10086 [Stentor coeruleus]|uniref:Ion transport domain-containing protein n=1 Tax=Stentor coeruleus TaxID=5963 RepID=A0A1R2CG68_9CILI|nr:hypothetical protein SteCoe_10086 [Stentor coeruleus]